MSKQVEFDSNDIHNAALCAWKEARGEGQQGMLAVLCVLRNRVGSYGFPDDLHTIIYGKNQFTSMSVPSDPEFSLQPPENDNMFSFALNDSRIIFSNAGAEDITNAARYYANLHNISKEGWFYRNIVLIGAEHPITAQIGKHTFFR